MACLAPPRRRRSLWASVTWVRRPRRRTRRQCRSTPKSTRPSRISEKRDLDECKKKLEAAVKLYHDLPRAQIILVGWFAASNQNNAVLPTLEEAVNSDPTDPEAYIIFGDLDLQNHRVAGAALFFDKANELLAKFTKSDERKKIMEPRTLSGLAAVAEARKKWPEAQKYIEALLKLTPNDTRAIQRLANVVFQQENAGKALELLQQAYDIDQKNAQKTVLTPDATLATFYEQFGDHVDAEKRMKIAVKNAPTDLRTWMVAGRWALETGEIKQAEKFADKAMELDPKSLDARMLRGVVALYERTSRRRRNVSNMSSRRNPATSAPPTTWPWPCASRATTSRTSRR